MSVPFEVNDPDLRDALFRRHLTEAMAALREDAAPPWGRMTAREMVEHLSWVFEVSTGRALVECSVPEERRERFKKLLYDNTPMCSASSGTKALTAGLPPLRHAGLDEARAALRQEVDRFLDGCRDAPEARHTHPVFGPIGTEEWGRSHFKHTYHHLLQFDLSMAARSSP